MDATVNTRVTPIISGKGPHSDLAPGNALVAGHKLREFEIVETLGEGGFSIVYGARDLQLMRDVAIKEYIPISLAGRVASTTVRIRSEHNRETFEAGLNGFINEARLLAQFKHHGLVEVLQFWEENGTAYMVMPRYTGKTLRSVLKDMGGRGDEPWLRGIVAPVLDVLELLHSRNVFHRDIAPDNILIKNDGTPVLLDLGSAREVVTGLQKAITVVVKPGYAPIEQYSSDFALPQGPWTDVYAVGALLHFAIVGTPPPASISRIMKDSFHPLAAAGLSGYSREFLSAVDRALALQPADRPQSIPELRELLRVTEKDKTVIALAVAEPIVVPEPLPPMMSEPVVVPVTSVPLAAPAATSEEDRTVIVSAQELSALVQQLTSAKAAAAAAAQAQAQAQAAQVAAEDIAPPALVLPPLPEMAAPAAPAAADMALPFAMPARDEVVPVAFALPEASPVAFAEPEATSAAFAMPEPEPEATSAIFAKPEAEAPVFSAPVPDTAVAEHVVSGSEEAALPETVPATHEPEVAVFLAPPPFDPDTAPTLVGMKLPQIPPQAVAHTAEAAAPTLAAALPPLPEVFAAAAPLPAEAVVENAAFFDAAPVSGPPSASAPAEPPAFTAPVLTAPAFTAPVLSAAAAVPAASELADVPLPPRHAAPLILPPASVPELTLEPMVGPEADAAVPAEPVVVSEFRFDPSVVAPAAPAPVIPSAADTDATVVMSLPGALVEAARAQAAETPAPQRPEPIPVPAAADATVVMPKVDALALARRLAASEAAAAPAPRTPPPLPAYDLDPLAAAAPVEKPQTNSFPEMEDLMSGRLSSEARAVAVPAAQPKPAAAPPAKRPSVPAAAARRPSNPRWIVPVCIAAAVLIVAGAATFLLTRPSLIPAPPPIVDTPAPPAAAEGSAAGAAIDPAQQPAAGTAPSAADAGVAAATGETATAPTAGSEAAPASPAQPSAEIAATPPADTGSAIQPIPVPTEATSAAFEGAGQTLPPPAPPPAIELPPTPAAAVAAAPAPPADSVKTVDVSGANPRSEARTEDGASRTRETASSRPRRDAKPALATTGNVKLSIQPWGEVWVNGSLKGVSPPMRFLQLEPGTYNIELRNPGLQSTRRQLTVVAGQPTSLEHRFQPSGDGAGR
jgi:non-specific serine/threonine protein kinase